MGDRQAAKEELNGGSACGRAGQALWEEIPASSLFRNWRQVGTHVGF